MNSKYTCSKNCCNIIISKYDNKNNFFVKNAPKNRKKSGVFVYTSDKKKILLVQSRGKYWGPPKGTLEENEDWETCAIRELKEESGIVLKNTDVLNRFGFIKSNAYYFSLEKNDVDITLQIVNNNNDANGIGLFNINCLVEMVKNNKIVLNQHGKIGIKRIFDIDLYEF
jgi:ADP-ribose pyrophosphatase YjhB (NUDIX family)